MSADFAPDLHYAGSGVEYFRFWCQKTLPLVYDDSLSYYELLSKVVKYVVDSVEDISELGSAYIQLQDYVNQFFDSVNIPTELANKMFAYVFNNPDRTPNIPASVPKDGVDEDIYTNLIRGYDALPMTKHQWGVDEANNPLYWYIWNPTSYKRGHIFNNINRVEAFYANNQISCTIMCSAGVHGNERQAVISLYNTIAWILESDDNLAKHIRDNFRLIIAPCVNPWGYINDNRYTMHDTTDENAYKTDINRNFPPYWSTSDNAYKGTEPYSTAGARFLRDFLSQIPEDNRYTTSYFDFHDFTGDSGTYQDYNIMLTATLPDAKAKALAVGTWIMRFMENAGYSYLFKSEHNMMFSDLSSGPLAVQYAFQAGFKNSFLFENRLKLVSAGEKYDAISAKISTLIIGLSLTMIAPRISAERTPTTVRRLADLGLTVSTASLSDIVDAMPRGAKLTYYIATALATEYPLANDLPSDRIGVLEIEKLYAGNYSALMRFTATDTRSNPATWLKYRLYGGTYSPWYQYMLDTTPAQNIVEVETP